ncbi:MAG: ankyrin repeat domain-containing protein, partial [Verrucomicrobiota bacterium]|nr:ankyrin repeat domain-containing protein [Verrucomicrobiota bacterium]
MVEYLVSKGADVNAKAEGDYAPLHSAKDIAVAKFLVSKGADIHAKDEYDHAPLHFA